MYKVYTIEISIYNNLQLKLRSHTCHIIHQEILYRKEISATRNLHELSIDIDHGNDCMDTG